MTINYNGIKVDFTEKELAKIAEIHARKRRNRQNTIHRRKKTAQWLLNLLAQEIEKEAQQEAKKRHPIW